MDTVYLLRSLSILLLLGLSAAGSSHGMMVCGASSALHSQNSTVLTYAYVAMIMTSTVFFYGFILAIILINKLSTPGNIHETVFQLASGLIYGAIGLAAGHSMGNISSNGFKKIAHNSDFYTSFMISLASVEVTVVIAFLCSLLIAYKV